MTVVSTDIHCELSVSYDRLAFQLFVMGIPTWKGLSLACLQHLYWTWCAELRPSFCSLLWWPALPVLVPEWEQRKPQNTWWPQKASWTSRSQVCGPLLGSAISIRCPGLLWTPTVYWMILKYSAKGRNSFCAQNNHWDHAYSPPCDRSRHQGRHQGRK